MTCKQFLHLSLSILFLSFSACKKEDLLTGINNTIELNFGKEATFVDANLNLLFEEIIEESRCPIGVDCIHAGRVVVQIGVAPSNLAIPNDAKISLEVDQKDTLGNIVFTLLEVNPYPVEGSPVPDDQQQLKLQVETL